MENKNEPAMPIELNGYGQYAPHVHMGLTKREMFAMNAPECPDWFKAKFEKENPDAFVEEKGYMDTYGEEEIFHLSVKLTDDAQMKLIKEWCYAYADLMLEE